MRTLTNGDRVLSAIDHVTDTWTFESVAQDLPLSGRSSWWGAFRRGDHLRVSLAPGSGSTEVRLLGKGFRSLSGSILGVEGGTLDFEIHEEGVYHLRFDGLARHRIEFCFEVRIPRQEVRAPCGVGGRSPTTVRRAQRVRSSFANSVQSVSTSL